METAAEELLGLAREQALAAGALLHERYLDGIARGAPEQGIRAKSTPTDLVSDADLAAERLIRDGLARARPEDALLGEEGEDRPGTSGLRWVVDPLDGTVNFLFSIPHWCVSVAVQDARDSVLPATLAGAIFDPPRSELFTVTRSGQARLGDRPLRGSTCEDLARAMVATGFNYDAAVRAAQAEVLRELLPRVRDIRRFGAAALDLAWTAAGRYDAFYERGVHIWDVAAGVLLCERAGLQFRELPARAGLPWGVLVAPAGLVEELHGLVA
jgi:myo-inositol-1(or 4)-monophosphatase